MEGISMKTYIQRPSQRKKNLVPAVVILGLLAAVFIIIKVLDKGPITHYISDRPSLAVLYFENNTGDASLAHWRDGFADLISTDLSQSRYLNILSGDRVFKILKDLGQLEATKYSADVLKQVAQKGKVRHILLGSYIKAGPKFRVSISIQDMDTGELVGSQIAEAENEESLFSLVDDLTQKIKSDLQLTTKQIANDFDKEAADILTSSPEAYKLFVEGLRHLYGGEYQLCIEFMDNAIAIDPEFVSAIGWKAFSYDSMGYHQEFVTAMTKAFELRNTVSERERIKFTAYYYMRVSNDIPKAKEELERWVSFYPEDKWANHQLGFLYYHAFEDYEKATEYLQNNIENRIEMFYSYYVMASAEMCLGNYDKAQDICELYISEIGDHPDMRFNLAINYFCRGNYDQAFTEAEKAAELGFAGTSWNDLIKGGILQAKGDIEGAKWYYQNMVDSRDALVGVMGREQLGELALFQGRFEEATSQIVQALNLAEATGNEASLTRLYNFLAYTYFQMGDYYKGLEACRKALDYGEKSMDPINGIKLALHLKGLSQLALGTSEAALKTVEELKILAEKGPSLSSMKDYFHLTASIEMNEGNFSEAKAHFEKAASLLPSQNQDDLFGYKESLRRTFYLTSLAESYLRAGNMDKALQAYEFLTNLTIGRHHWSDLHAKAFYWLGKIYEQQGDTAKAIEHYKKFLDLWKDADPGLPEVDDAKKRLDGLR
jgi:tetratricopeptide (TPR) repeat protein